MHRAAGGNHVEVCRYLLEKGAKVDQPDKSGRTALHWAAISGHKEAAELLVASGACLFVPSWFGVCFRPRLAHSRVLTPSYIYLKVQT